MARNQNPAARFDYERALIRHGVIRIAGIDEAGRGALAGPVAAAAAILPSDWATSGMPSELEKLNDSKQLTAGQRDGFYSAITGRPEVVWSVQMIDAGVIDRINILQATHQAMNRALLRLEPPPAHVLVDGLRVPSIPLPQTHLVRGDSLSYSIAAASVLAKVTRDRLMLEYDARFPEYGFAQHKGYGTAAHLAALRKHGPCPIHRVSFAPSNLTQTELFSF